MNIIEQLALQEQDMRHSDEQEQRLMDALERVRKLHPEDLDILSCVTWMDYDRKDHGD